MGQGWGDRWTVTGHSAELTLFTVMIHVVAPSSYLFGFPVDSWRAGAKHGVCLSSRCLSEGCHTVGVQNARCVWAVIRLLHE